MTTPHLRSTAARALLVALGSTAGAQASAADPRPVLTDSGIRSIIKERVDSKGTTGIAVGVIGPDGQRRIFTQSSGLPRAPPPGAPRVLPRGFAGKGSARGAR